MSYDQRLTLNLRIVKSVRRKIEKEQYVVILEFDENRRGKVVVIFKRLEKLKLTGNVKVLHCFVVFWVCD